MKRALGSFEPETDVLGTNKIAQHAFGSDQQLGCRTRHGTTQHADRIADVRARVGCTVQQRAH